MKFEIDQGIEIPSKIHKNAQYSPILNALKVGESFLMPNASSKERSYVLAAARWHKIKIITRTVEGGIRVWRIE